VVTGLGKQDNPSQTGLSSAGQPKSDIMFGFAGEGGHLRLAMIRPSEIEVGEITCIDSPGGAPTVRACMNASTLVPSIDIQQNFGPKGTSDVQVNLPMDWRERDPPDSGCAIAANTLDRAVVGISWAYLFEAASAVNAKCVRQGKSGIWIGHGERYDPPQI